MYIVCLLGLEMGHNYYHIDYITEHLCISMTHVNIYVHFVVIVRVYFRISLKRGQMPSSKLQGEANTNLRGGGVTVARVYNVGELSHLYIIWL